MADEDTTTTQDQQDANAKPEESATDSLGDAGKKALDAERREKRAAERRANELEARLKEFEDRDKTEAQKLVDRAEAAERRVAEIESRAMRLEVAAEKGLTPAQAKRLVGASREELEADADELLATFQPVEKKVEVPDLDLGPRVNGKAEPSSPQERINAGIAQHMK